MTFCPVAYETELYYSSLDQPGEYESRIEAFHDLKPRAKYKARRMQKKSILRRKANKAWRDRQRRIDQNAQEIY